MCSDHVFPPANLISPVADVLRSLLGQVNWGRSELGLPLLAGEEHRPAVSHTSAGNSSVRPTHSTPAFVPKHAKVVGDGAPASAAHSVLNMEAYSSGGGEYDGPMSSRRPLLARAPPIGASDSDDNKYKKRSPAEMFRRWSR